MKFIKNNSCILYAACILILTLTMACKEKQAAKKNRINAEDTILLVQTMLNNQRLKDSLFSGQRSQELIIYKDSTIPWSAVFYYNNKQANIQSVSLKNDDIWQPRFLMVLADIIITDSTAALSFELPDIGQGIYTSWKKQYKTQPWELISWGKEQY